jgi:hypothetical protein
MSKTKRLPKRTQDEVLEWFPWHRQSLLADADTCMLRTKWRLEVAEAYPLAARMDRAWDRADAARGVLAHRYAAAVLRTLWQTGADTIPVAEALEILYEVCAQRDVPDVDVVFLPARERRYLRMFAILLVFDTKARVLRKWNMSRMLAVEERQWAAVSYVAQDGSTVKRTITGQPDLTLAAPPDGVVVLDWKTTPKAPPKAGPDKRDERGDVRGDDAPGNVSYEGYFQQRVYALLEFANRPDIGRVTLREVYPMDPDGLQVRTATLLRQDLERIERELSDLIGLLDRAIAGGSGSALWKPQPGRHCSHCPRPGECPIPREERGDGAITGPRIAEQWAAEFVVADSVRTQRRNALKAYHEETGLAIPVRSAKGRYELRHDTGTRSFGMHVPEDSDRGPEDPHLASVFRAAAERRRAAA